MTKIRITAIGPEDAYSESGIADKLIGKTGTVTPLS